MQERPMKLKKPEEPIKNNEASRMKKYSPKNSHDNF